MDNFSHGFVVKIVLFVKKGPKINEKEAGVGPFLKKDEETWFRAVVVTRLAEQLLPTPEIHCLNPAKFYLEQLLNANCIE